MRDGYTYTAPTGQFQPNAFGLWDVMGNVAEWCGDWYGKYYYGHSLSADPEGPSGGELRVLRGDSWSGGPNYCRSAARYRRYPSNAHDTAGFRVVVSPNP